MGALGGIVNGIFGVGSTILNNAYAEERERTARRENFDYNERAANNADARTRALFYDLYSPQAQMQQIKEAGLSPSLFYGDLAGISGQTGAQGAGASGIAPHVFGIDPMTAAQIQLLDAQTRKTNEEANQVKNIAGATVSSLLAEAGYKEAAAEAAKAQKASTELDNYVKEQTKDASIYKIRALAEEANSFAQKTWNEAKIAGLQAQFDQETMKTRIGIVKEQMNSIVQSICESKSAQHLNEQQKAYLRDQILQNISETELNWNEYTLNAEKFEQFIDKQIPIMQKELDVKLGQLELSEKRLIVDAVTESLKAICIGAATASTIGRGSNATPSNASSVLKPRTPNTGTKGKAVNINQYNPASSVWAF